MTYHDLLTIVLASIAAPGLFGLLVVAGTKLADFLGWT